jgi:hypothetical protein
LILYPDEKLKTSEKDFTCCSYGFFIACSFLVHKLRQTPVDIWKNDITLGVSLPSWRAIQGRMPKSLMSRRITLNPTFVYGKSQFPQA